MSQVCVTIQAVRDIQAAILAAGQAHEVLAPGRAALQDACAQAAAEASGLAAGAGQQGSAASGAAAAALDSWQQDWSSCIESATQAVLLWAQGVAGSLQASPGGVQKPCCRLRWALRARNWQ